MFDIVIDYPDSLQVVNELNHSSETNKDSDFHDNVANELRYMLGKHLHILVEIHCKLLKFMPMLLRCYVPLVLVLIVC